MNGHRIAIVVLHTIVGLFVFGCVATIWVAATLLAPTFEGSFVPELVAMFGKPIASVLLALAVIEVVAALAFLRSGVRWPRYALATISVLLLFAFPIGTAIALYTFVVLARGDGTSPTVVTL